MLHCKGYTNCGKIAMIRRGGYDCGQKNFNDSFKSEARSFLLIKTLIGCSCLFQ